MIGRSADPRPFPAAPAGARESTLSPPDPGIVPDPMPRNFHLRSPESELSTEMWRSRAALARQAARALCEEARIGTWIAGRHFSYSRWLIAQARSDAGNPPGA